MMNLVLNAHLFRKSAFVLMGSLLVLSTLSLADEIGNPEDLFKKSLPQTQAVAPPPDPGTAVKDPAGNPEDLFTKNAPSEPSTGSADNATAVPSPPSAGTSQHESTEGKNKFEQFLTNLGTKIDQKAKPLGEKIENKFANTIRPLEKTIVYSGYCEDFITIKKLMYQGKAEEVALEYAKQDMKAADGCVSSSELAMRIGYLGFLERGTLAIDRGDTGKAVERFTEAENILSERQKQSKMSEFWTKAGEIFDQTVSGDQEKGTYWGEGYERVLMLNYKTIAFLLAGDRGAYNVTRRAIDWQQMEKEAFEERLKKAMESLSDAQKQHLEDPAGQEPDPKQGQSKDNSGQQVDFTEFLASQYGEPEAKVKALESAYVNPFGYYMAGVIQEFEGYNDPSLRPNARIAYEKALDLNRESQTLKTAADDLKASQPPADKKLLHVIVGEGFSPEKKVLISGYAIGNKSFPLKLPYFERVPSKVHRMELRTLEDQVIGELSTVADVEAICLRHQMDMLPIYNHQISLAFFRDAPKALFGRKSTAADEGGAADAKKLRELDTRAWMSLPSAIKAGRFFLEKGLAEVKLIAFDVQGEKLSEAAIRIEGNSHTFVYARSIDHVIYTYASKPLWLENQSI